MVKKKRGLGRGLAALIPDEPIIEENEILEGDKIVSIDITLIEPNKEQPRSEFNEEALMELANSIKIYGLIQPIIVRKVENGYQLVAGERRWRAAKIAGLKEIPCIVRELQQLQSTKIALMENLQRENLNPIEEAIAYKGLIEKYGLTQEEVSEVVGKSRSYIANLIRLLSLDGKVIELIMNGQITSGHGKALLSLENEKLQIEVAEIIIKKDLNVRETEKLVKELNNKDGGKKKNKKVEKDSSLIEVEEILRKALGTKVQISKGKRRGKIEIEYYNDDDLERIIEIITKI